MINNANIQQSAGSDSPELLKDKLKELTAGYYFPSESDFLIEPVEIDRTGNIDEILKSLHPDKAQDLSEYNFEEFYQKYGVVKDWQTDIFKIFVRKFGEALNLIRENLTEAKVFWIGRISADIYIIGKTADGKWIGLKTGAVQT